MVQSTSSAGVVVGLIYVLVRQNRSGCVSQQYQIQLWFGCAALPASIVATQGSICFFCSHGATCTIHVMSREK